MTERLLITNRKAWRGWLEKNHVTTKVIWLVFFKKHSGKSGLSYNEAVEEALCFGWIDSIVQKIDEECYCQKFTPRKKGSSWSHLNKQKIEKLIKSGQLINTALQQVIEAKADGSWYKKIPSNQNFDMPAAFTEALNKNHEARLFFENLAPSYRKQYIGWIASAKKEQTKLRRIKEALVLLENSEKLGMK